MERKMDRDVSDKTYACSDKWGSLFQVMDVFTSQVVSTLSREWSDLQLEFTEDKEFRSVDFCTVFPIFVSIHDSGNKQRYQIMADSDGDTSIIVKIEREIDRNRLVTFGASEGAVELGLSCITSLKSSAKCSEKTVECTETPRSGRAALSDPRTSPRERVTEDERIEITQGNFSIQQNLKHHLSISMSPPFFFFVCHCFTLIPRPYVEMQRWTAWWRCRLLGTTS
ncbi:hypothetical protein JOB18_028078 [Solea senegalensis]|uniref:Uncharacterized protein n=1 Tax=Solea senegalensis TaxID=28829 RepID=A0AAV6RRB2_SOLSE|nr:hypothetical protein JOB18_028078 [Solea senegalensis]